MKFTTLRLEFLGLWMATLPIGVAVRHSGPKMAMSNYNRFHKYTYTDVYSHMYELVRLTMVYVIRNYLCLIRGLYQDKCLPFVVSQSPPASSSHPFFSQWTGVSSASPVAVCWLTRDFTTSVRKKGAWFEHPLSRTGSDFRASIYV